MASDSLTDLFRTDPERVTRFTRAACGVYLDTAKQFWTAEDMNQMLTLAQNCDLEGWRRDLFAGVTVNTTENRPALHMALRTPHLPGSDDAADVRHRMKALVNAARSGALLSGRPVETILHIGVGGSALGPKLVIDALGEASTLDVRFLDNVDAADLSRSLRGLNLASTLVVIVSKTFTTLETSLNARAIKTVFENALGTDATRHFIAATAAPDAAKAWGIPEAQILPFWAWVGGRFSLWSSAGITIPLALGWPAFEDLLNGASAMDQHTLESPFASNLPTILAFLEFWNRQRGYTSRCVIPYSSRLAHLVPYLQQLEMESNGKGVDVNGQPITQVAAPVVWGGVGTTAQHAFFQSLHQGVEVIPAEFVLVAKPNRGDGPVDLHTAQLANGLAQAAALMTGQTHDDPHQRFSGNRPSTTLLLDSLTPETLGALLAMYEHKTALAARLWGINPFDQFGVELGKQIASQLTPRLSGANGPLFDPSTERLIAQIVRQPCGL